ncbi:MAG: ABC transporter substrate-binding protein [Actinomycetota bacterium]|nr:ABC transporter substrate-binding protein [Actinomycetota bacterium]
MTQVRRSAAVLLALALLAGCGSRRSHDELMLSHQAGATTSIVQDGATGEAGDAGALEPGAVTDTADGGTSGGTASGGTTGSATGTGGIAGSGRRGPATGSTIRIGVVGTLSGPAGEAFGPMAQAVQVWSRWINDRGGLNNHRVEVVVGDDGGDPARHRSMIQEFVEQKKVLAFVANPEALTGGGTVEYLKSVGVPVIGSENAGQWFYESPVHFPQGSHGDALLQAGAAMVAELMKEAGQTKIAAIGCQEVQACRDQYETAERLMGHYGLEVVYKAQVSLVQPDFTAECVGAQRAGAEVITIGLPANAIRSIARACARQGYRPILGITAGAATGDMAQDPNLEGMRIYSSNASFASSDTPNRAEFQQAMKTYLPRAVPGGSHILAWTAAKVLELASADLPADPTSKDILDGLAKIHGDVLPDLTGPLLFNPGRPAERSVCQFATTIKGGKFVPAKGGERVCVEFNPALA